MLMCAYSGMRNLSQERIGRVAGRARALGDPTRVRILDVLARGEQPVGHLAEALDSQQSTISKHLQVLHQAGLVQRRRAASAVIYSLSSRQLIDWMRYLSASKLL
jgi:DNA-binding transcriptional ArsR family regulator